MAGATNIKDPHAKSVIKGLTWRFSATAITTTVSYFITGEVGAALTIGGMEFILKLFWYYLHERVWISVPNRWFRVKGLPVIDD